MLWEYDPRLVCLRGVMFSVVLGHVSTRSLIATIFDIYRWMMVTVFESFELNRMMLIYKKYSFLRIQKIGDEQMTCT